MVGDLIPFIICFPKNKKLYFNIYFDRKKNTQSKSKKLPIIVSNYSNTIKIKNKKLSKHVYQICTHLNQTKPKLPSLDSSMIK